MGRLGVEPVLYFDPYQAALTTCDWDMYDAS